MARADLQVVGRHLHGMGANVTAVGSDGKKTLHGWKEWQDRRQTVDDVDGLPWPGAAAVGVLVGVGAWRIVDIDAQKDPPARIPQTALLGILIAMGLPVQYPWYWRSSSGTGWQFAILATDDLPGEFSSGVLHFPATDQTPYAEIRDIELRWCRCMSTIWPNRMLYGQPDSPPAWVDIGTIWHALSAWGAAPQPRPAVQRPAAAPFAIRPTGGHRYGQAALQSAMQEVATAPDGERNNTLFRQAAALVELVNGRVLSEDAVRLSLESASRAAGLQPREAQTTIDSAFSSVKTAREVPA